MSKHIDSRFTQKEQARLKKLIVILLEVSGGMTEENIFKYVNRINNLYKK